jgi:hypothetical protein
MRFRKARQEGWLVYPLILKQRRVATPSIKRPTAMVKARGFAISLQGLPSSEEGISQRLC